jgi:hypothetical protein
MKWYKGDGYYYSEDERFTIIKATDRIHAREWKLYDSYTNMDYYKPTLNECKYVAATYCASSLFSHKE